MSGFEDDFDAPKDSTGKVTKGTIFRGFTSGDLVGPYISQFLLQGNEIPAAGLNANDGYIRYGTLTINQHQITVQKQTDFLTNYNKWLDIQNGKDPLISSPPTELQPLFIRNLRDLTNYVHFDDLPQEFINAALILLHFGIPGPLSKTFNSRPYNPGNPYFKKSRSQEGFATFGPPHILTLVAEVTTRALKAAWFQKWFVHRSLRPEEFGDLIHNKVKALANCPIDPRMLNSPVLQLTNDYNKTKGDDTYLLPQAYPEGSPLHPSYPSGHATIAGACVTVLKAFFDESVQWKKDPDPADPSTRDIFVPDCSGTMLNSYTGPDANNVTVGGELNKLASNIAIGRNAAGVHYRRDAVHGLKLGEKVAIGLLRDQRDLYNEPYCLKFHDFDGKLVSIRNKC